MSINNINTDNSNISETPFAFSLGINCNNSDCFTSNKNDTSVYKRELKKSSPLAGGTARRRNDKIAIQSQIRSDARDLLRAKLNNDITKNGGNTNVEDIEKLTQITATAKIQNLFLQLNNNSMNIDNILKEIARMLMIENNKELNALFWSKSPIIPFINAIIDGSDPIAWALPLLVASSMCEIMCHRGEVDQSIVQSHYIDFVHFICSKVFGKDVGVPGSNLPVPNQEVAMHSLRCLRYLIHINPTLFLTKIIEVVDVSTMKNVIMLYKTNSHIVMCGCIILGDMFSRQYLVNWDTKFVHLNLFTFAAQLFISSENDPKLIAGPLSLINRMCESSIWQFRSSCNRLTKSKTIGPLDKNDYETIIKDTIAYHITSGDFVPKKLVQVAMMGFRCNNNNNNSNSDSSSTTPANSKNAIYNISEMAIDTLSILVKLGALGASSILTSLLSNAGLGTLLVTSLHSGTGDKMLENIKCRCIRLISTIAMAQDNSFLQWIVNGSLLESIIASVVNHNSTRSDLIWNNSLEVLCNIIEFCPLQWIDIVSGHPHIPIVFKSILSFEKLEDETEIIIIELLKKLLRNDKTLESRLVKQNIPSLINQRIMSPTVNAVSKQAMQALMCNNMTETDLGDLLSKAGLMGNKETNDAEDEENDDDDDDEEEYEPIDEDEDEDNNEDGDDIEM